MRAPKLALLIATSLLLCGIAFAGGPLFVGGPARGSSPAFGNDGQPFIWNPAKMPIQYRVDPGPLAATAGGTVVLDNAHGLQRLQAMFNTWQQVSTASVSFNYAGALSNAGAYTGGDVKTAAQYNAVFGSCKSATQNPVVFDADGSILSSLGLPAEVIGFTSICALDGTTGYISGAMITMNGAMQDGVDTGTNYELSADQFDEAITHEMGHYLGLDHSQINLQTFYNFVATFTPCPTDELAGLPLMFPIEFCQSRKSAGLPLLAPDDISWISRLYPNNQTAANYGTISGVVYFQDGKTAAQGINVIARAVDDPSTTQDESQMTAVSVISGYRFTGNPGQDVTAAMGGTEDNTNGDPVGSRNSSLIGYYEIHVPPGNYTVEVESIEPGFSGGSGMGPLDPPVTYQGLARFWKQNMSSFDIPLQRDAITVHAGDTIGGTDFILPYQSNFNTFDMFEDEGRLLDPPLMSPAASMIEVLA